MKVHHHTIQCLVWPLQKCELSGLLVQTTKLDEYKFLPLLESYFCDILESRDRSAVASGI